MVNEQILPVIAYYLNTFLHVLKQKPVLLFFFNGFPAFFFYLLFQIPVKLL